MKFKAKIFLSTAVALVVLAQAAVAGQTLDTVKDKGYLTCGVHNGLPGFSSPDDKGRWTGIDVDVCRAVAAAVFGDASKVRFTPLSAKERLTALQSGEVDVLSRNTTWTLTRDAALGLNFTGVTYYDGQGFLVRRDLGVTSALDLAGASVCVQTGTTTELNLGDYFRSNGLEYSPVVFEKSDETLAAYEAGRCDALTSDRSQLYAHRIKLRAPTEHVVLPEVISKEPLGPVVRQGDDAWFNIVKWSLFAMVNAEELGIDSGNAGRLKASSRSPAVRRLMGVEGDKGKALRLGNSWAYDIVSQVGNYGEVFERNLGADSPLQIDRGLNKLWSKGGLQYAPPVR
ncbi:MAG: amino acid ABC transporter substrate-binding protein [Gammaproteobacteria bacterium]|nr:amino acid ABC transporter substrate-binding protein [Gammaproteobacteria bacterium]MDJ0892377.1 amino acid ABC transporter substrate-binding protein [Gammaproteobacteria bacterium]